MRRSSHVPPLTQAPSPGAIQWGRLFLQRLRFIESRFHLVCSQTVGIMSGEGISQGLS